jgi:hypothetical protein
MTNAYGRPRQWRTVYVTNGLRLIPPTAIASARLAAPAVRAAVGGAPTGRDRLRRHYVADDEGRLRGNPRKCSAMMLRWTSVVPP